ncbi:MAG: hypothetical protein M1838_004663 [Thelocarpon superellum]|nr:MAG: hypothetical protein M1838_004663 [Thelocarpon superellum]
MGRSNDEFPLLAVHGLYAASIRGNGNCLFNALSDQLYGNQEQHHTVRAKVIEYMREHQTYYKQFIDVNSDGGRRRNPKRKTTGASSGALNTALPSCDLIDSVFETHLQQMAKGGTWGDNMEISAFSAAYGVDVKIYQRELAYVVSGGDVTEKRHMLHIAYHVWQHYSSIRNIAGPHTGIPHVHLDALDAEDGETVNEAVAKTPIVSDWMIELVMQSLPYRSERLIIRRALEEHHGNVDAVISKLLDPEEGSSYSSATGSSSVEREPDSDDEDEIRGPSKKQDRRMSKASRAVAKSTVAKHDRKMAIRPMAKGTIVTGHAPHVATATEQPDVIAIKEEPDNDDVVATWWPPAPADDDTSSSYSANSKVSSTGSSSSQSSVSGAALPSAQRKAPVAQPIRGPKRVSARDRADMKKAAQKSAAKERKRAKAGGDQVAKGKAGKGIPPVVEQPFRTLYI